MPKRYLEGRAGDAFARADDRHLGIIVLGSAAPLSVGGAPTGRVAQRLPQKEQKTDWR